MRAIIGAVVILALASTCIAADVDAKKLIGKWEMTEPKGGLVLEFTDKGKVTLTVDVGGKSQKVEGTYKVNNDKLDVVLTFMGEEKKETLTVTKLTDDELITKDSMNKEDKFKKAKAK